LGFRRGLERIRVRRELCLEESFEKDKKQKKGEKPENCNRVLQYGGVTPLNKRFFGVKGWWKSVGK
jgi:hypothetical protein